MIKIRYRLLLLFRLITISNFIYANENNVDSFRDIESTQRILELRKQQEYIDEQFKYLDEADEKHMEEKSLEVGNQEKCFFKSIEVIGNLYYKKEIEEIIAEHINTEMGKNEIFELLEKISNIYLKNGYITTLVTLKSGNLKKGELIFEVKEGKIRDIKYKDESISYLKKMRLKLAFPIKKEDLIEIKAIDQGIENLNIGGKNSRVDITPTELYGYSDILIEEEVYDRVNFSFGIDNSSYKDKGREKSNIYLSHYNPLELNDRLTLSYIERLTKKRNLDKERNYDIGYFIPIGYWKFYYNYNLGDSYSTLGDNRNRYKSKNKSEKHKLRVSRILSRGQYDKTTFNIGIIFKDNKNYLDDIRLDVSSKKYTNLLIGLDHSRRLFGGSLFGNIEYERGVPWFGAEGNSTNMDKNDYVIEYSKLNLNFEWIKMFLIANNYGFQYRIKFGSAYSEDMLLVANKFSIGDEYTIRGFKESSASGNKGAYINNTITYIGYPGMNKYLAVFKPFVGLDVGISKDKGLENSDKLVGVALGIGFNIYDISGSLTYGIPLKKSTCMPNENNPIYFNLSYSI